MATPVATVVRAEPYFYKRLSDKYKPYFLPIEKEYEKDGYKVYQMPLVEIIPNSPNNLDKIYEQIPENIIDDLEEAGLTFDFGRAGSKIYITSYEGHKDIAR